MSIMISGSDHGGKGPDRERKELAERLKALVEDTVKALPEDQIRTYYQELGGTAPCLSSPPGVGAGERSALQTLVALRTFRATRSALENASEGVLMASLGSATDIGALARIVSGVQFSDSVIEMDPLAGPVARSIEHRRHLKAAAGELLSSGQVEALFGVSRQAIDKRRRAGRLLALKIGSDWAYPALQFENGAISPLMEAVLIAHKDDDPWVILDALLAPDTAFGGRSLLDLVREQDSAAIERYIAQLEADGYA